MNRYIYIALLFLTLVEAKAQRIKLVDNLKPLTKRADTYFENQQFDQAALLYEIAYKKDTVKSGLALKAANSYYAIKNYEKAEIWYTQGLIDIDSPDKYVALNYMNALLANQKYDDASKWLNTYIDKFEEESTNKYLTTLNKIPSFYEDSASVDVSPLNINTEYVEYGPSRYGNGIVFLSDQYPSDIQNVMEWNTAKHLSIYYTEEREDGSMREPVTFQRELGVKHQIGPIVFLDNHDIIFTRSIGSPRSNDSRLELMMAKYDSVKQSWGNVKALTLNNENYSVGYPAVNESGDTLIFASNMPGGFGGMDLYISIKQNQGWSNALNLGAKINTIGNDMFPYFSDNDEIVFASNGHEGLGDLDLFRTNIRDTLSSVENLGYPYNSGYADFGYISDKTGTTGYFASNRDNGGLDDDLYRFDVKWSKIRGQVVDENHNEGIKGVEVKMIIEGVVRDIKFSDEEGKIEFISLPNQDITFNTSMKGYLPSEKVLTSDDLKRNMIVQFNLPMVKNPVVKKVEKPKQPDSRLKDLLNKKNALVQVDGRIFEYREIGKTRYLVNADQKILLSKGPIDMDLPIEERVKMAVKDKGLTLEESYFLKNIYFSRNSIELNDSAKLELKKVVRIMTTDLKIAFEINTYADSRGSMASNDELTFKRAQSIGRYLMANDISGSRLIMEISGEQGILNECLDDVECLEINHAVNRRAELKLVMRKMYN